MENPSEVIISRYPVKNGSVSCEQAIRRWLKNPHLVNRRISTAIHLATAEVHEPESNQELLKLILKSKLTSALDVIEITKILGKNGIHLTMREAADENGMFIIIHKMLPRSPKVCKEMIQITIIDLVLKEYIVVGLLHEETVISLPLCPIYPFSLKFVNAEILLVIFEENKKSEKSVLWLKDTLFPKLKQWADETNNVHITRIDSLSLIPAEKYVLLYQNLKEKYGQKLVDIWPEKTDPKKYVYEDVAIATYLLLVWEGQRVEENRSNWRQSFVDVGCGNGLLVYILTSEGYPGIGIDVRRRGIWSMYPSTIQLKEQTFIPSDCNLFPEADWVIGNHSDELTPWIPVITARSSYKCRFFLLPCCAYDFTGHKYQRLNSSQSQYSEYLDYIKSICEICGFETKFDRLKIPSTKRICLLACGRNYSESCFESKQKQIIEYIKKSAVIQNEMKVLPYSNLTSQGISNWHPHFKAREYKEKVRNCTQLQNRIVEHIVNHVVKLLLEKKNCIKDVDNEARVKNWNAGGCMKLSDIAASLSPKLLIELKKECGGLQTLLKNNHEIFCVSKGMVKISMPVTINEKITARTQSRNKRGELKIKQKSCWFFSQHPDGCPLRDEECTFCH